jgi:hypothetical protein
MKSRGLRGDIEGMSAVAKSPAHLSGPELLMAHSALDVEVRLPAADRLRELIGPDLTRLLLVALAGNHRLSSRDRAA